MWQHPQETAGGTMERELRSRKGNPLSPQGRTDNMFPDPHIKIFINPDTGKENTYVYVGHDEGKGQFIMRDWYVLFSEEHIPVHHAGLVCAFQ